MALNIEKRTTPFGSFSAVDVTTNRIRNLRIRFGDTHPGTASWEMVYPNHERPLEYKTFIRIWDDADEDQDEDAPLFEGYIEQITPGEESNSVQYVAYDPTRRTAHEFPVMSEAWPQGTVDTVPPEPGVGAYPRVSFNVTADTDDDYATERANGLTVGGVIATLLDDAYHPLYWASAAPGDGTSAGNGSAYESADLSGMEYKPQEKLVFESTSVRDAVLRVLTQYEPAYRLFWIPGTRKWRFYDVTQSNQITLTLNDENADDVVLSLELHRSIEGRWSAVKIFGPPTLVETVASTEDGSLTIIDSGILLQNNIGSCCNVTGLNRFQITDSTKRRVSRTLPEWVDAQIDDYNAIALKVPHLMGYWPQYEDASWVGGIRPAGWRLISGWFLDALNGIIYFPADTFVYRYNPRPAGGEPNFVNPTQVAFIYAYPATVLEVRWPESGFDGTSYSVAGLENELKLYDEMLAVGYEQGNPVTTPTRRAQFTTLAKRIHAYRKDIVYAGGCMLDGLRYEYRHLNRRVNFAGVDADGGSLTTGWESINAVLTDVEYDFEQDTTTLQFSSDQLELIGMDPDLMKARLNIRALQLRTVIRSGFFSRLRNRRFGERNGFHFGGDILETSFWSSIWSQWVDEFGNAEGFDPNALD